MIDPMTVLTIVLMASVTYLTRIGGYLFMRGHTFGPRLTTVLETAPGCVLITIIAPQFVSGRPADLIALGLTILAATRLPVLPTVVVSIAAAAILRSMLP